jgi:hypothetical protein
MDFLKKELFRKICDEIINTGRPLEAALCRYHYYDRDIMPVVEELRKYQNSDGGFGNCLEPDFLLPDSTPMATTVAFQLLSQIDHHPETIKLIKDGINYFELTFVPDRKGWFAVTEAVNNYPHAPWWHYDAVKGMTIIDDNWGNPTAEILGYLYLYREYVMNLEIDELIENAFRYLEQKTDFKSFHEIFCYIRLYNHLPDPLASRIRGKIVEAVSALISRDPREWASEYVPAPMDFISSPGRRFGIEEELVNLNLEYLILRLEENRLIIPSWGRQYYEDELRDSWNSWKAILTLKALLFLDAFGRIEK